MGTQRHAALAVAAVVAVSLLAGASRRAPAGEPGHALIKIDMSAADCGTHNAVGLSIERLVELPASGPLILDAGLMQEGFNVPAGGGLLNPLLDELRILILADFVTIVSGEVPDAPAMLSLVPGEGGEWHGQISAQLGASAGEWKISSAGTEDDLVTNPENYWRFDVRIDQRPFWQRWLRLGGVDHHSNANAGGDACPEMNS
ncbi:hypothetical protein [Maricaulis virginensis]|uniref:Uncharacterized protein n=1 Tax=Maricaulis virginensis TaxID=144022 RepID=A0A9W6MP90_9PROT|nr:hypothetical protein [Maricaulis virginensis]GLK52933.1 hypothetical protein GCM10017621_24410 [Maricaulis virginensis]